ncbi:15788_t:CDS:2 [Funneliformis caledonium]|uniref:15788_t:CDS:1 n=1 Tax=Funneliformis caledonium TaxID=1117310 RepID=A0A9N9HB51_9GLOM|nr:15788_t:CDS:2 [Funneliformis caledonium]
MLVTRLHVLLAQSSRVRFEKSTGDNLVGNDELSSKAQEWLHNFDIMIKSSGIERHWILTKVNKKREKTQALELISAEKEEQHFYNVRSNIAKRFNKHPSSFKEPSDSKKIKSSGQTPTIDVVYDGYETSTSDYTSADTEKKSTDETLLINLVKFEEVYSKLDPNCMWVLESDQKVEEVIYEFARNLPEDSAQLRSWRSIDKPSQAKPACKPARSACIYI